MAAEGLSPRYLFPAQGDPCPHCRHTGHMVWRPTFAHCHYCGFVSERPVEVMPMTDSLRAREARGGQALIELICAACGASYRTQRTNPRQLCQKCRDTAQGRKWRKENQPAVKAFRQKYKMRKLKLGLSSGGAGGDVENITQERRLAYVVAPGPRDERLAGHDLFGAPDIKQGGNNVR